MYKHILVPVDLNDKHSWRKALPTAIRLCEAFQATLHLVTVLPEISSPIVAQYFPEDYEDKVREHARKALKEFADAQVPDAIECHPVVAEGRIYKMILEVAKKVSIELIVMGSHTPEISDFLLGPNAAKVVRHATCSVMVVRE